MVNLMVTVLSGYVDSGLPVGEQVKRIAELRSIVKSIEVARGLDLVNRTMNATQATPVASSVHASKIVASKALAQAGDFFPSNTGSWYHMGDGGKTHFGVIGCGKPCRTCGAIAPAAKMQAAQNTVSGGPAAKPAVKVAVAEPKIKRTYSKCASCGKDAKAGYEWFSPQCPSCRKAQG